MPFENPHHTGENIAQVLAGLMEKTLNATQFEPVITTDSAANMQKGVDLLPGVFWLPCILHCLHNSVRAGLDAVDSEFRFFEKVKGFVRLMGTSPKHSRIFKQCQLDVLE